MHALLDFFTPKSQTVTSTVSTRQDAPSISYSGISNGLSNILQLTDVLRSRDFPGSVEWHSEDGDLPADISLTGTSKQGAAAGRRELVLPFRVHLVIPTPDLESVKNAVSKREQPRFSLSLRQERWRSRIITDEAEIRQFYLRMHLPTMASRHSEAARTETLDVALHIARRGGLFLAESSSEPVAGCLFTHVGGVFTTRLLGVDGGADEHYETGAFKSLYYMMLQHCATSSSIQQMDLFGTEAFISKGIFQWKRKLGAEVQPAPNHFRHKFLRLKVNQDKPGVRQFLLRNPILINTVHGLVPIYFFEDGDRKPLEFSAKFRGLDRSVHIPLDEFMSTDGNICRYVATAPDWFTKVDQPNRKASAHERMHI
ncbi:hypothetical protein LNV09_03210 [Paucibacter sp. B2R-40]|uniref:hypothetical protein n=1 Tax=Paucibacter sp. B2R-40 TaxID=2893554 RepID=UPI0021E38A18|nr:hypothetical protein [Paucibacter sp. B2R-40]MCV2353167.1 hypothetical protein [Paucibacter sp. B2R-40]